MLPVGFIGFELCLGTAGGEFIILTAGRSPMLFRDMSLGFLEESMLILGSCVGNAPTSSRSQSRPRCPSSILCCVCNDQGIMERDVSAQRARKRNEVMVRPVVVKMGGDQIGSEDLELQL